MTENQELFVKLEKQKEEVRQYFEKLKEATEAVAKEIGVGGYFQDTDGTVYRIVEPEGKFVNYEKISYVRTRREGEARGTLSLKEAEGAGFTISQK